MVRAEAITLIGETPGAHGVFDPPEETRNEVPCSVRSVGYNEFYAAKNAGIEPSVVFVLALAEDYAGEKVVEWNGARYRVIRTWMQGDGIEITCEPATNDRKAVTV